MLYLITMIAVSLLGYEEWDRGRGPVRRLMNNPGENDDALD